MKVDNVVPNKLHQELADAGVECNILHNLKDGRYFIGECEIKFAEGADMVLAQRIIDSHDPIPLQPQPNKIELLRLEQAKSNTELFEIMLTLQGGM